MIERILLVAALSVATLTGCVINVDTNEDERWLKTQRVNERAISQMRLGRDVDSVRAEMGSPDFTEAFNRNGSQFEVLFYRTHRQHSDGRTTRDETTPLVFVDGELVGWGESAIEHATSR
ncbi:MAG: DUF3192 domain-containing protein [Gammaproteobacteria bacterium]|nr:DUF3192 domain-containing protein [Gammaproteobacteria bacterium]